MKDQLHEHKQPVAAKMMPPHNLQISKLAVEMDIPQQSL